MTGVHWLSDGKHKHEAGPEEDPSTEKGLIDSHFQDQCFPIT